MEVRKVFKNVNGISSGQTSTGTLRLADFHLIFSAPAPQPPDQHDESAGPAPPPRMRESWITYPMICQFIFRPTPPKSSNPSSIRMRCRDFTYVMFTFVDDLSAKEAFEFIRQRTCKLRSIDSLYAFHYRQPRSERGMDGWSIYDPRAEFMRQGINEKSTDKGWRLSTINHDYSFCDTYPSVLAVPSNISDNTLKYAKDFRSRNRIPVLTYLHPVNMCTIMRSSQPRSGILRKTNIQDERLVSAAFNSNLSNAADNPEDIIDGDGTRLPDGGFEAAPIPYDEGVATGSNSQTQRDAGEEELAGAESHGLYDKKTGKRLIYGAQQKNLIVDARPTINAIVNQVQGFGSETMDNYKHTKKIFLYIGNIHVMRNSLQKVVDAIKDADVSALPPNQDLLQSSEWLKHIHSVLAGADTIARSVGIGHSHALIHCSDGWDRTSQLCALSEIMLDPYYRTLKGFMVLVEKDWASFGHMFRLRSGHLNHENWFTIQKDALAATTINPGETDTAAADAFYSLVGNARRYLQKGNEDTEGDGLSETVSNKAPVQEATDLKMVSPVFHQFLDCVYQLMCHHPTRFEYNERFLRRLLYHLYSCQYGTFLFNSEKQRHDARAHEVTTSVWDYFLSRREEFTNPRYDSTIDDRVAGKERLIFPNLGKIRWWHQCFNRGNDEMNVCPDASVSSLSDFETPATQGAHENGVSGFQTKSQKTSQSRSSTPRPHPSMSHGVSDPSALSSGLSIGHVTPTLQSSLTADSAHDVLTSNKATTPSEGPKASLEDGGLSTLRDGVSNLKFRKGVLSSPSRQAPLSTTWTRTEDEMQEMM
ncbi:phosphatidylinositol-3-phosphatase ymr1 [Ceratocystis pirilliformis]|uniref:Phosphatidylinositol-3-phosphatase ymr1 n=1 Tax=Ceratocystis pirilliformis TaxID=259994 RepID=A0ABR3YZ31_9PEZI